MVKFNRIDVDFKLWSFENFFVTNLHKRVLEDCKQFDFFKIEEKRISRPDRIYMHQHDIPSFKECVALFNSVYLKKDFSDLAGEDFTNYRTRIELCKDLKGSWLEEHTDDPAKRTTMQIYLTDADVSTSFDNKHTVAKTNNGWFFVNTGTEKHGLPPLEYDRVSIIVNWVDETWMDSSVLCKSFEKKY